MRTMSRWINWICCIGSVLLALAVLLQAGFVRLHVVGAFSELQTHGIIDESRLNEVYA